uniref:Bm8258 n=1 Tax=Brugia malayi TaxID=6279 RepID=A0A1I9FZV8_BRUMA|nr:Bm8258 [Brugia malayi]
MFSELWMGRGTGKQKSEGAGPEPAASAADWADLSQGVVQPLPESAAETQVATTRGRGKEQSDVLSARWGPVLFSAMDMEAGSSQAALQKLCDRLCTETEPRKLYKALKKLAAVPSLSERLAEIGFRQTIKILRKQQLLVPFARDLAAKWGDSSPLGPRSERDPLSPDSALVLSEKAEQGRTSPAEETQASTSRGAQDKRAEALQLSSSRPVPSRKRSTCQTPEASDACRESLEPAAKKIRRCRQDALRGSQEHGRACSLGACPNSDHARYPLGVPELSWGQTDREVQLAPVRVDSKTPVYSGARKPVLQQEWPEGLLLSQDLVGMWEAHCHAKEAIAAHAADATEQPALQGISQAKEAFEAATAQAAQEAEHGHAGDETETHSQTETKTQQQMEEADQELRLQAVTARIRSRQAKKLQGRRQTKMVTFFTQARSPGQPEVPGPPARGPSSEAHLLPQASGHGPHVLGRPGGTGHTHSSLTENPGFPELAPGIPLGALETISGGLSA